MRNLGVIDGELRLVTRAWCAAREVSGHTPSTELIDQLLDERLRWRDRCDLARQSPFKQ